MEDPHGDIWTVITGKKAAHRRVGNNTRIHSQQVGSDGVDTPEERTEKHLALVQTTLEEVRRSPYWAHVRQQCGDLSHLKITVWGLGSLERQCGAYITRYQLALALLLIEERNTRSPIDSSLRALVEMYDPVFTTLDKAVIRRLCDGCIIPDGNNDGLTAITVPTLMYMPHCELILTLTLLYSNMRQGTLKNITMIGNSLQSYYEQFQLTGNKPAEWDLFAQLMSHAQIREIPLPEKGLDCPGAFNNLSLHMFS